MCRLGNQGPILNPEFRVTVFILFSPKGEKGISMRLIVDMLNKHLSKYNWVHDPVVEVFIGEDHHDGTNVYLTHSGALRALEVNGDLSLVDFLGKIDETNSQMSSSRTSLVVLAKAAEELGELSEALLVKIGQKAHRDLEGPVGEACDLALCALSLALKEGSVEEVQQALLKKMAKWSGQDL